LHAETQTTIAQALSVPAAYIERLEWIETS